MKINKKILFPLIGGLVAIAVVFLVLVLTTAPVPDKTEAPATADEIPSEITTAPATEKPKDMSVTLSFVGDCILGIDPVEYSEGSFIWYSENYPLSYFFEKVYDVAIIEMPAKMEGRSMIMFLGETR